MTEWDFGCQLTRSKQPPLDILEINVFQDLLKTRVKLPVLYNVSIHIASVLLSPGNVMRVPLITGHYEHYKLHQRIIIPVVFLSPAALQISENNYNINCNLYEPSREESNKSPSMSVHMEGIGHVVNGCMKARVKTPKAIQPFCVPQLLNYLAG